MGRRRGGGAIHLDQNRGRLNVVLVHHDRIIVVHVLAGAKINEDKHVRNE